AQTVTATFLRPFPDGYYVEYADTRTSLGFTPVTLTIGTVAAGSTGSSPALRVIGRSGAERIIQVHIEDNGASGTDLNPGDNDDQMVVAPNLDCFGIGMDFKNCPLDWLFNCDVSRSSRRSLLGRAVAAVREDIGDLQTFYGIRDRVFAESTVGRRYVRLYDNH